MTDLPAQYTWLNKEPGPRILLEAIKLFGTHEVVGAGHSPIILAWADEIGGWVGTYYNKDEIPWCGLFVGICAKRAGFPFTQEMLSAAAWQKWGIQVTTAKLGDVIIFKREGGGHVGLYVGEDAECYHILGGNQANQVSITRITKLRMVGIRRCDWHIGQPANVRRVFLKPDGVISTNEG